MRLLPIAIVLTALTAAAFAEEKRKPKAPPPPGVRWEADFKAGMARAAREGRPMFFAVNALETESANQWLANTGYRSKAWGDATRGYVSFVCNPGSHGQGPGACTRYPGHTCAGHIAALGWFLKRFGQDLISPQHVIIEPDGVVAFRKEYYTRVVGPSLLENWLSKLAPSIAYARAGVGREQRMKALGDAPLEEVDALAEQWLDGEDGLAAAAITNVLDDCFDAARRIYLIRGLRHASHFQVPVLMMAAEERVMYPAEEKKETLAWLATLFGADRDAGVWGATRALVRLEDKKARDDVMRVWGGVDAKAKAPGIDDLPEDERARAFEALILAKDERGRRSNPPQSWSEGHGAQIRRAWRLSGRTTPSGVALKDALDGGVPRPLRQALLAATPEETRANRAGVLAALLHGRQQRVRIAAALALLKARVAEQGGLSQKTILEGIVDPLEGPETRQAAVAILGDDPGQSIDEWARALAAHRAGGAK